jgi:hypothetical protein
VFYPPKYFVFVITLFQIHRFSKIFFFLYLFLLFLIFFFPPKEDSWRSFLLEVESIPGQ